MASAATAAEEAELPAAVETEGLAVAVGTDDREERAVEHAAVAVQVPEHQSRPVRQSCIRCCGREGTATGCAGLERERAQGIGWARFAFSAAKGTAGERPVEHL